MRPLNRAAPSTSSRFAAPARHLSRRFFKACFTEYHRAHPEAVIDYVDVGSGEGTKRFLSNEVDFAASDSALTDGRSRLSSTERPCVPITAGIIVLAYNPQDLPSGLRLPRDVYIEIFLGSSRWNGCRISPQTPVR